MGQKSFWNNFGTVAAKTEILEHRPGTPGGFFMPSFGAAHPQYTPLPWLYEEEKQDFLRVTGEYGRSAEARLGVSNCCTVAELAAIAQKKVSMWHGKAASGWMMPGAYVEAASIIARSYEQMYFYLNALSEE